MNNDDIRLLYNKLLEEDELLSGILNEHKTIESSFYLFKSGYTSRDEEVEELKQTIESLKCCGNCGNGKNSKYGKATTYCDDCENNEDPPEYWSTPPSDNWKGITN
jgi:NADH pyrophosphatase NudC (nudix superfamily)